MGISRSSRTPAFLLAFFLVAAGLVAIGGASGASPTPHPPAPAPCTGAVTATGPFSCTVPAGVHRLDVLLVGGGAGGGAGDVSQTAGGGGGGGEVVVCSLTDLSPGDVLSGVLGAGGAAGVTGTSDGDGGDGVDTTIEECTALGGLGGVSAASASFAGDGGDSGSSKAGGTSDDGGLGVGVLAGGGGGGAGADGGNGLLDGASTSPCNTGSGNAFGGAGGAGKAVNAVAAPGLFSGNTTVYGGGGGGGAWFEDCSVGGAGGTGGGGGGADAQGTPTSASAGSANTGGGGGGGVDGVGTTGSEGFGAAGGSGYVAFLAPVVTTTATQVSATSITFGGTINDVATVTAASGTTDPTGTVQFSYCSDPSTTPTLPCTLTDIGSPVTVTDDATDDGVVTATLSSWQPPSAGKYLLHAEYSGDSAFGESADDGTNEAFTVNKVTPTVTYTGTAGVLPSGTTQLTLSATVSPSGCTPPAVTYAVNGNAATSPFALSGAGVYEIVASYAGNADCEAASTSDVAVLGTAGDATTGGGWYKVDQAISGNPRISFGHTVQKQATVNKKTGYTTTTYRGQMLWVNTQAWRLKGTVNSSTVTNSSGYVSGDTQPAFVTFGSCPAGVGTTGSNPKCGAFTGTGTLQRWVTDHWETATEFGASGVVRFTATVYDGGSVSTCSKRTCTVTDVADWFGLTINGVSTADHVPVGTPSVLQKSQNGSIKIR